MFMTMRNILRYSFKGSVPHEFKRKPRSFSEMPNFKATELRLCLLYTGLVLFRVGDIQCFTIILRLCVNTNDLIW